MDRPTTVTEQRLLQALMQFKRLGLHHQSIAGCKPSEIRVLFIIKRGTSSGLAEIKVSEISKKLHVTSPTITQLLNSLEANELVERRIDVTDRRAIGVRLTDKGEMVAQQAADAFNESMHELTEYLGAEQSDQLAELLTKVIHYFDEKNGNNANISHCNGEEGEA